MLDGDNMSTESVVYDNSKIQKDNNISDMVSRYAALDQQVGMQQLTLLDIWEKENV